MEVKSVKNILESIGMSISHAVDCVVEKNRKAAQINRLKLVIRREEQISEKAYIALGKYYYHNLRDVNDPVTEPHCAAVEESSRRMDRAITRLEEIFAQQQATEESGCSSCGFDCSGCQENCGSGDESAPSEEPAEESSSCCEEACCCQAAQPSDPCCCEETSCEEAPQTEEAPCCEVSSPVADETPIEDYLPKDEVSCSCTEEAADPRDNREIPFQ